MVQEYKNYTEEDFEVWKILFDRQIPNLQDKASEDYLVAINTLSKTLNGEAIPNFDKLNEALATSNGWSIEVVKGLIPVREFFSLLSDKKFCSSTWLRKKSQLDYLEEPDMFHDIFGHTPLLVNKTYALFMHEFGQIGKEYIDDEVVLTALQRLYWFTIEFGLMKNSNSETKIYGAGILSSFGESNHVYNPAIEIKPFVLEEVISTKFVTSEIQKLYYQIEDFDQLYSSLKELRGLIDKGLDIAPEIV